MSDLAADAKPGTVGEDGVLRLEVALLHTGAEQGVLRVEMTPERAVTAIWVNEPTAPPATFYAWEKK